MDVSLVNFKMLPSLTPGEALVLLNGKDVAFKQLLKLTLMDLLLKKVLAIKPAPESGNLYIHRGTAYADYRPFAHEEIYTAHFSREPNREVLFANLIQLARRQAGSPAYLRQRIMRTPQMMTAFERGFWINLTDKVKYTDEGALKRTYAATELNELTNMLPELYNSDQATIRKLLRLMQGNLFLTEAIDHNLLMMLDDELSRLFERERSNSEADGYTHMFFIGDWDFESSFDDGFGSDSGSDGGSDGGGDSGCGGCGGGD